MSAAEYRTVAMRVQEYEKLRKLVTEINKREPTTKDGIKVVVRIGDVVGFAIEKFAREFKIK